MLDQVVANEVQGLLLAGGAERCIGVIGGGARYAGLRLPYPPPAPCSFSPPPLSCASVGWWWCEEWAGSHTYCWGGVRLGASAA